MTSPAAGLILASAGSYPRVGDTPELQLLRRTISGLDRGECSEADLLEAENHMTVLAISEQVQAGLDVVTDGLIRWYDPVSHVAGKLENVQIKGLVRFFDTNFYYRQPVLTGKPLRKRDLLADEFFFALNQLGQLPSQPDRAARPLLKLVLTGPYTLAKFSQAAQSGDGGAGAAFRSLEARADAFAEALVAEVEALAQAGAELIQVDEPAILKYPQDWAVLERALAPLAQARDRIVNAGKRLELALYVYFHDCAPLYEKLIALPVDAVGLDFTYNPALAETIFAVGSPKPLGLGLLDARSTKLEDVCAVAKQVEKLLPKIAGGCAHLNVSAGLEYLPRHRARTKLQLLAKIRAEMNG